MRRHPLRVGATLIVALAAGLFTSWLVAMAHAKSEADAALASAQRADRSRQRVIEIIGDFADATGFDGSEETIRNVAIRLRSLLPTLPEPSGEGDDVSWYVRMIAGTNFLRIGDHAEAEVLLERALAMARAVRDDAEQNQQANIAQSAFQLGRLRRETGEYTEAEALFLEAIERYGRVLDPGASEINDVEGQLARLYAAMGRRDDAEAHYRRFLEGARGQAGPQVIDAQGALGEFLLIQGRLDEAAAHLLAAWQSVGTTTPPVTRLMLGRLLGWLHAERARRAAGGGRREEAATEAAAADRMFEETLAGQRSYFGTSHEQLARTLVAYGSFLRSQGRYGEARTVLDEAVSMAAATVGPHDELTLASLNSLAALLYDEEETESAEATWRGIVADGQVSNSVTSVAVPTALRNLAVLCLKQGRRDEARAFAEALLARTPPDHPDLSRRRELLDRIEAAAAARTDEP
jgi:tetratricopeptide (TPR) repeat protein